MTTERLKKIRESLNMNMREFSNFLGVKYTTYVGYENGSREPGSDFLTMVAIKCNTTTDYILGLQNKERTSHDYEVPDGFEPLPKMNRVPLLGSIACGTPITAEENVEEYINAPADISCAFVLRCKGDSMVPRVMDGDLVYIRQQPDVEDGQIAAVVIDGEATLKHVYHIPNGVQLVSDNPAYAPLIYTGDACAELRIVGLAVAYQRRLI